MVLICYLKKSALAILQKVTSHENWNPLTLPPLGTERIMINAHEISRNWGRSYQISETKFKLLRSMTVLKSGANFDLWILLLPLLVCLSLSFASGCYYTAGDRMCQKWAQLGTAPEGRATHTPSDLSKQMTYTGGRQFTWEKGNLCRSLYLTCILRGSQKYKVNTSRRSITGIHHSKFI